MIILFIIVLVLLICMVMKNPCETYRAIPVGGALDSRFTNTEYINIFDNDDFKQLFKESIEMNYQPPSITLNDIPHKFPYSEHTCLLKSLNGNGQRKLCLEQIQMLTKFRNKIDILLYTGSAPGNMHGVVVNLFPKVKFILADPNDHNIFMGTNKDYKTRSYDFKTSRHFYSGKDKVLYFYDNGTIKAEGYEHPGNIYDFAKDKVFHLDRVNDKKMIERISKSNLFSGKTHINNVKKIILNSDYTFFIVQDFFDIPKAEFFRDVLKGTNFGYTSDIRSRNDDVIDYEVLWNLAQQYIWTKILNPLIYKLKFRIPFQGTLDEKVSKDYMENDLKIYKNKYKIDQVEDYKKGILTYLPGEIYVQAWAPISSTEARLVGTRDDLKKKNVVYKEADYTAKFFYYNNIYRPWVVHKNDYIDSERHIDRCADCSLEISILEDYKNRIDKNFNILEMVDIFRNMTKFKWFPDYPPHGFFYDKITYEKYKSMIDKYRPTCAHIFPTTI